MPNREEVVACVTGEPTLSDASGTHDGRAVSHERARAGVRGAAPPARPLPRQRAGSRGFEGGRSHP